MKTTIPTNDDMFDPDHVIAEKVILMSSSGDTICENYDLKAAKRLVTNGKARVLSSEAIAFIKKRDTLRPITTNTGRGTKSFNDRLIKRQILNRIYKKE